MGETIYNGTYFYLSLASKDMTVLQAAYTDEILGWASYVLRLSYFFGLLS